MYDQEEPEVQLLYKYRSCQLHNIQCLQDGTLWFSTNPDLNDPFDCHIRLPRTISPKGMALLSKYLRTVKPYNLEFSTPEEFARHIAGTQSNPPLEPLGILATQLGYDALVDHIRKVKPVNEKWIRDLVSMALELVSHMLNDISIFCLTEDNDNELLWAHYAGSHSGFCTGYVAPTGIATPRIIHKVHYTPTPPMITPRQLVDSPGDVWRDLTMVKSEAWSYEREWRLTLGGGRGLWKNLLPCRSVILGARIAPENETLIREAIHGKPIQLYRALPSYKNRRYGIAIVPAD